MWREVKGFRIAVDRLIEIYVNEKLAATLVATPIELEELALGYLYAEGYVESLEDVAEISVEDNAVRARIAGSPRIASTVLDECGGVGISNKRKLVEVQITEEQLRSLASEFGKLTMPSIEPSLAMHTSALLNGEWTVAHDVSRHSSVLKLVGKALKKGLRGGVVFTTGRASSDMVIRAASMGASIVVSLRGPLYSGIEAACKLGVTLVANVRGKGFVALCNEQRILREH